MPIIHVTCVQSKIVSPTTIVLHRGQMCSIAITLYPTIIVQPAEELRGSMFLLKRPHKWRLTDKSFDRIPTRWRLVIAGLIGSGTGLLILTMWAPGSTSDKSSASNQSLQLTPKVQSVGIMTRIRSLGYEKSADYCEEAACSTVTCSSIPDSLDPGQIASDYITRVFKSRCPDVNGLILVFDSCAFPNETLKRSWLNASLTIDELTFSNCALANIPEATFATSIFANLKILRIKTTKIRTLKKWIFQDLPNLKQLSIIKNTINEAEYDLLRPVADSLEILELDDCFTDSRVLSNIAGESVLARVQIASIQRNSIGTLSSKILNSIPNVQSLFLGDSRIENCDVDAFVGTQSLQLLDMTNNLLKNLPAGIFASLPNKKNLGISIQDNPWNCTCQFQWIQNTITDHPSIFKQVPKCRTPAINAGLDFRSASFCPETVSTSPVSPPKTSTSRTDPPQTTQDHPLPNEDDQSRFLSFTCKTLRSPASERFSSRKLFSTDRWKFPSPFRNFFAKALDDGTILVNVESASNVSLIWFPSPDNETLTAASINCVGAVSGPYLLTDLVRGRSYTVCLLEDLDEAPSPFHCLATRTESLKWSDAWLTYDDRAIVVSLSVMMILIVSIVSVLSSFLVIRRNPSLLRGSKRIVMVRNRDVEALVLPQRIAKSRDEVTQNPDRKPFNDDPREYLTPLEVGRCAARKDSKTSGVSSQYSAGSYVSAIVPSSIELADWRKSGKTRSCFSCPEEEEPERPPPLPPHRAQRHAIPSLSLSVEALANDDSKTFAWID